MVNTLSVSSVAKELLIPAIEKNMGPIQKGWASDGVKGLNVINPASSLGLPYFLLTLGLSQKVFSAKYTKKDVRVEYLMEFKASLDRERSAQILLELAEKTISYDDLPGPGDVVKLPDGIWKDDNISFLYFTMPYLRDDRFMNYISSVGVDVVWVLPITQFEHQILKKDGREALEAFWIKNQTNLHDPLRRFGDS